MDVEWAEFRQVALNHVQGWKGLEKAFNPYNILFCIAAVGMSGICGDIGVDPRNLQLIFAKQDKSQLAIPGAVNLMQSLGYYYAPEFVRMHDSPPIQAADCLAWCIQRYGMPVDRMSVYPRHRNFFLKHGKCTTFTGQRLKEWASRLLDGFKRQGLMQ